MWAQVDEILRQAAKHVADKVAEFLPGALVAIILILVTLVVAALVRLVLARALLALDFDRRAGQLGLTTSPSWSQASASQTVARIGYWTVLVLGLLVSLTALNATMPTRFAMSVFHYFPNLLAAFVILVVGAVAAQFLARSVLIGAVNMGIQSARLLALTVKWLVLLVAVAMALDHLGIGRTILLLAFGILFGGIVLAAALALGLGAKDAVSRALERPPREPAPGEDKLDHV